MEDWFHFPHHAPAIEHRITRENATGLRNWLFAIAALVFAMVLLGGATRLTESGLSITQWKPVTGVIPPLSEKDWLDAFEQYKEIPQFKQLFPDMDLAGFKVIYAWEWTHRLLGRLIGLVFVVGFAWFWIRDRIPQGYKPKLFAILALGGLQGVVGWWMVSSGLVNRVEVAQERLAIHLLLAAALFSACIWIAGGLGPRAPSSVLHGDGPRMRFVSRLALGIVFVQLGLGALVAGLRAGFIDNTWPLMEGGFSPSIETLFSIDPWWRNFLDNPILVQFLHRLTAYVLLALTLLHMIDALSNAKGKARTGAIIVFGHVVLQASLGIATLVMIGPEWLGAPHIALALAHQAVGFGVLAVTTLEARRLGEAAS
ncbi:COX15/CtaA family protein [Methylocystis heyeri]|uniref:Heme A synthase n=1 Tax=Methylocystis heyeri TaxID=391905 RepID=A0A6B8KBI5_9HYPH|nr:COX15/CtaA family protein [Methylocystis heyeri]QGM45764.1 heme A synthase [Methylocystis heyeri]